MILRDVLSAVGILLIACSVYVYDSGTPFPGLAALLPCLGTFLFVWSNNSSITRMGRLLGLKPLVGVGLISYSLYLWHWPLIVFAKYYVARPLNAPELFAVISLSMVVAVGSWKFIERPFRGRFSSFSRNQVFGGSVVASILLVFLGGAGNLTDGFSSRPGFALFDESPHPESQRCFDFDGLEQLRNDQLCTFGTAIDSTPDFILWGDSHANAFFPAFAATAAESGKYGVFAGEPGCPPLLGVTLPAVEVMDGRPYDCREFNDAVLGYVLRESIQNVFLVARWNLALGRISFEHVTGDVPDSYIFFGDDQSTELSLEENLRTYERGLGRTHLSVYGALLFNDVLAPILHAF